MFSVARDALIAVSLALALNASFFGTLAIFWGVS